MTSLSIARRIVRETRETLSQTYGAVSASVSLPAPYSAAVVHVDGRVTAPLTGVRIPDLERAR